MSRAFLQLTYLVIQLRLGESEMDEPIDFDTLIDALIEREGGYVE